MPTWLRAGDTLAVWKLDRLDRLGRSLKDLVALVTSFQEKGGHFVSLRDHLDTTTAQGRLMFNLFASLAEFECDIIRERTKAGLTAARPRPPASRGVAKGACVRLSTCRQSAAYAIIRSRWPSRPVCGRGSPNHIKGPGLHRMNPKALLEEPKSRKK